MFNNVRHRKMIFPKYPYCFIYSYNIDKEINKWLKENKIKYKFYMDGDDPWDYIDTYDTISFVDEQDAMAFVLRFA